MLLRQQDVRIDYGHFIRPVSETGAGHALIEPALGYAVLWDSQTLLFDTGIAEADEETDEHYRPYRRHVTSVLADAALDPATVSHVVNSHLHFEHCGGNQAFP
jgi:N-acyl homoserine lactone hydrolase